MLFGEVRYHVSQNQIVQLFQGCISMSGWFVFSYPSGGGFRRHMPAFLFKGYGVTGKEDEIIMNLLQNLRGAAEALMDYAQSIPVIDTHEHIPVRESDYLAHTILFGELFNPYVSNDLISAGVQKPAEVWGAFHCVPDDWQAFAPAWQACKHGSYARPIRIALQEFYGVDDFTEENFLDVVAQINANNTEGIYDRIFRQKCNIETSIVCAGELPDSDDPLLCGNIYSPSLNCNTLPGIRRMAEQVGCDPIKNVEELVELGDVWMELLASRGAMEFKTRATAVQHPDRDSAQEILERLLSGETICENGVAALSSYVREFNARKCAELQLPFAIHTGVWEDYRAIEIADQIPFILRHPETRMDLYHAGIPHPRDAIQIVKNFPNAYLNLCWSHIVAPDMVVQTMKEAIDMVPMNKIFAFGGDYVFFIEKVYGHLQMARENLSLVLGDRVDRGLMDLDEAKAILKAWFYDNPKQFYKL